MTEDYKALKVPFIRFHDTGGNMSRFEIDISRIFPDFDRNENDASNYYFDYTDVLIKAAVLTGAQIIYRLGESIDDSGISRYARPPRYFDKWADICLHIIMHYNSGWANGFEYGIRFWEIWNEPDLPAGENGVSHMWAYGTPEQAYRLYETAVKKIKAYDSDLYVGGMAFCAYTDIAKGFIEYCAGKNLPLDFLSYHVYTTNPQDFEIVSRAFREFLDSNGYENTALVLDEWNYVGFEHECEINPWTVIGDSTHLYSQLRAELFENQSNTVGASFCAAAMICMDNAEVDIANYYDGQPSVMRWCGLYDRDVNRNKTFYAFEAFSKVAVGMRAECQTVGRGIYAVASKDGDCARILAVSYRGGSAELFCEGLGTESVHKLAIYALDGTKNLEQISEQVSVGDKLHLSLGLGKYSVMVIEIKQ